MKTQLILNIVQEAQRNKIQLFAKGGRLGMKKKKTDSIPADLLKKIKNNEQGLIDFFENQVNQIQSKTTSNPIRKVTDRPDTIAPSFAQERLWFIDRFQGSQQYHIPGVLKISGALNVTVLKDTVKKIVDRHESLRTIFEEREGAVFQKNVPSDAFEVIEVNRDAIEDVTTRIKEELNAPFDLAKDYMLRATLIHVEEKEHILILVAHHIAADGWSLPIMVKELEILYNSNVKGNTIELPPLAIQYADYSLWQREELRGTVLENKLAYWEQQLKGVTPLDLPTDFVRPVTQTTTGTNYIFEVEKKTLSKLKEITQTQGATLFMSLLSVYKTLLYKYTANEDLCVGTPVANREQSEVANLIGFFVNTIALRSQLNKEMSFVELLQQIKTTTLEAYNYQDVPFEKIVDKITKTRDQSRAPIFQTMLTFQNNEQVDGIHLGESNIEMIEFPSMTAKFDLSLDISDTIDGLTVSVEYNTDLYTKDTIVRFSNHFKNLLTAITVAPHESIGKLLMLSQEEEETLIGFNQTAIAYPENTSILELFAEQVRNRPKETAIVFEDQKLSFEELDKKTNQLAQFLKDKGVKKECLVPICVERSFEMMIGIVGILKAGGAYVPIDPTFPVNRIDYILEDIGAEILLTQDRFHTLFKKDTIKIISLDTLDITTYETSITIDQITPEQLAYVIYTSGTTGKPKGVLCEHKGLYNRLLWMRDDLNITTEDVILQKTTYTFDVSVWELTMPLIVGCTLVFAKPEGHKNPIYLQELIAKEQGTIIHFVPSMLSVFLEDIIETTCDSLRHIVCSGEALTYTIVKNCREKLPEVKIHNLYGPTEAAIDVTAIDITTKVIDTNISIGSPVANTQIYILNENLQKQPIGVTGELCIGGIQVARGYLNRKSLTEEKFIENPFIKGEKIYKTGDLASWKTDGSIAYIGRKDNQVKIRGYRIELGEIESLIDELPEIQQSVVTVNEDAHNNKRLIAYVVSETTIDTQQIEAILLAKLPEYMVPKHYMVLDTMPLSVNGKIDRKQLPELNLEGIQQQVYSAPETAVEIELAQIWSELLTIESIGINDNFFELGGHSLLAVRLISRIRAEFSIILDVKAIFEKPTIAQLAKQIDVAEVSLLPVITKAKRPELIPLSYTQERLWFIDKLQGSHQYHMPAVLSIKGEIDTEILKSALKGVLLRHEVLRTTIREIDGKGYQKILSGEDFTVTEVSIEEIERYTTLENYIEGEIALDFDLALDYMLRVRLIKISSKEYRLVLVMHHIASDGWSIPIFVKELEALYRGLLNETISGLDTLPVQYADYSIWQRIHLTNQTLEEKLNYWEDQLKGNIPLSMPVDYAHTSTQSIEGLRYEFEISAKATAQLKAISKEQKSTLFMTLLSAYKILLFKYTGEADITVGSPIANREQIEIAPLIGFFVNTIALRSQLDNKQSFTEILASVRETTLDAYQHQEVPFEKIVDRVEEKRSENKTPIFQTLLTLQNNEQVDEIKIGESAIELVPHTTTTTKFELSLDIVEKEKQLAVAIEYNTALYKEETIQRFAKHFSKLIDAICDDIDTPIAKLTILDVEEEKQIVEKFNATTGEIYDSNDTVLELFEQQVQENPTTIAVRYQEKEVSYQALDEKSNQLAHYILKQGIQEKGLIPISMDRSVEMMIGILAILKTGNAYVPIDPTYPEERIKFILKDCRATIILTEATKIELFKEYENIQKIYVDRQKEKIAKETTLSVNKQYNADDLAYVIYTSGTTGTPKGTLVPQRGIVRLSKMNHLPLNQQTTILQLSTISFDAATFEIWCSLLNGGTVALYGADTVDLPTINNEIEKHKVNTIWLTSALFDQWAESDIERLPLKYVVSGGDVLTPKTIEKLYKKLPDVTVINGYGPTENTTFTCCYEIPKTFDFTNKIPIGTPITGTKIYVLDDNLSICPIGVAGELYTAGDGVALGYLNQKQLTDERFIENPFQENEKLYKTGDIVRWSDNGTIEFIGRKDSQVKIRGYRIELNGIETVLNQLEEVQQAIVIAREDEIGNKYLTAYVVVKITITNTVLETKLKQVLPSYMMPKFIMQLDEFPITKNGKIDRKALPIPNKARNTDEAVVVATSETEKKLVAIYKQLLAVDTISVTDNFFELGGDSIKAIQLVSRAKSVGVLCKVKDIFVHQTIQELALHIREDIVIEKEEGLLDGKVGLLPIQQWFFEQDIQEISHYNQSILLKIDKEINSAILTKAVELIRAQHDVLGFHYEVSSQVNQRYTDKPILVKEEISDDENTITSICKKYQKDLNIYEGEIARFVKIETPENETQNRLFIAIHHLAIDGVSWRILLEDLYRNIEAIKSGNQYVTSEKLTSYRQWQEKLAAYARSTTLQQEVKYWQKIADKCQELPQDTTALEACIQQTTNKHTLVIEEEITKALLQNVNHAYHTEINDILLSALTMTLSRWLEQQSVVIGVEGHGREDLFDTIDINKTIGWFTSLYPVHLEIKNNEDAVGNIIANTKDMLRMVPAKGIGYGILRYLSTDEIKTSLTSNFEDIIFNYLGSFDSSLPQNGTIAIAEEDKGNDIGDYNKVPNKIAINSMIAGGKLHVTWSYDSLRYNKSTIEQLAKQYKKDLTAIIDHCKTITTPQKTVTDYGLLHTNSTNGELTDFILKEEHPQVIEDLYPLSPLQEGMLFHSMYDDSKDAYLIQFACDFVGEFDEVAFQESWKKIIASHTILRTKIFPNVLGTALQCVYKDLDFSVEKLDFSDCKEDQLASKIAIFLAEDKERGFSIDEFPLMRVTLIKISEDRIKMVLSNHHILWDGWSLSRLMSSFMQNYEAYTQKINLPEFPVDTYGDQVRLIQNKGISEGTAYWKKYLQALENPSYLPYIKDASRRNTVMGNSTHVVTIDTNLTTELLGYAKQNHVTVNTLVQGAWAYLLSRYTNQNEVAFGATVSGRDSSIEGIENRIGLYINTIPVCTQIDANSSVVTWLQELQQGHTIGREEYNYVPLGKIQTVSGIKEALFDTLLVFENYPVDENSLQSDKGLQVENVYNHEQTNYVLAISFSLVDTTLSMKFMYHDEVIDKKDVITIEKHLKTVLESFVKKEATIETLKYITSQEQNQILTSFNDTQYELSKGKTVLDIFQKQLDKTPDAIAVVVENNEITYKELDNKSNQLAHYITNQGVTQNELIPICVERSVEMIVGILAILKVGATYVPIDPNYPQERIDFILEDTEAIRIIGQKNTADLFKNNNDKQLILLDTIAEKLDEENTSFEHQNISDDQLAYIIYTSGTTGTPKGVMIEHKSLHALLVTMNNKYPITAKDRLLLKTTFSFDVSVYEIFGWMYQGGSLGILPIGYEADLPALIQTIQDQKITHFNLVPSLFSVLVAALPSLGIEKMSGLKHIMLAGEKLPLELILNYRKLGLEATLENIYGPTEATIYTSYYDTTEVTSDIINVPIGKPLDNINLYVLNETLQPQAIGVKGELCISGIQVAKGYWKRPELTAKHFVDNPFVSGERLYKTGDLVQWLPDGTIEYIGRKDTQVKIRGYRIELGEIETKLERLEAVQQSLVTVHEDVTGEQRLLAYLTTNKAIESKEIEEQLRWSLPEYMVPKLYSILDEFPLTPNGKIDRKLLPKPSTEAIQQQEYSAPETEVEKEMVAIWEELLAISPIGVKDNFFDIGGHSLLAVRLIPILQEKFAIEINIKEIFEYPTISSFSKYIELNKEEAIDQEQIDEEYDVFSL